MGLRGCWNNRHRRYSLVKFLWKQLRNNGFAHFWRVQCRLLSFAPLARKTCLNEDSCWHVWFLSMPAKSSLEVAIVQGLKCSPPNAHALHLAKWSWCLLQKSWSSTNLHPWQWEGHSKWTRPPWAKTISANSMKVFNIFLLSNCLLSSFLRYDAPYRWMFMRCHEVQGLQGSEAHKSRPRISGSRSFSCNWSMTCLSLMLPHFSLNLMCDSPICSDTFPRPEFGLQQHSIKIP